MKTEQIEFCANQVAEINKLAVCIGKVFAKYPVRTDVHNLFQQVGKTVNGSTKVLHQFEE